jgi:hypothetical protein
MGKSFLVLFFKKELLPFAFFLKAAQGGQQIFKPFLVSVADFDLSERNRRHEEGSRHGAAYSDRRGR